VSKQEHLNYLKEQAETIPDLEFDENIEIDELRSLILMKIEEFKDSEIGESISCFGDYEPDDETCKECIEENSSTNYCKYCKKETKIRRKAETNVDDEEVEAAADDGKSNKEVEATIDNEESSEGIELYDDESMRVLPQIKTVKEAVANIKKLKINLGYNLWKLGHILKKVKDDELWKKGFKSFTQFLESEDVDFTREYAYALMSIAELFDEETVVQLGIAKLQIIGRVADEEEREEILQGAMRNKPTVEEIKEQVSKASSSSTKPPRKMGVLEKRIGQKFNVFWVDKKGNELNSTKSIQGAKDKSLRILLTDTVALKLEEKGINFIAEFIEVR